LHNEAHIGGYSNITQFRVRQQANETISTTVLNQLIDNPLFLLTAYLYTDLDSPLSFPSIRIPSMHLKIKGLPRDWKKMGSCFLYTVPVARQIQLFQKKIS